MPAIKSAKKKLRQDKKRQKQNKDVKDAMKLAVKKARTNPSAENLRLAFKSTDKAAKNHIIHENKASRLKSLLSKLLTPPKKKVSKG
jgi:small subunit ribosomal protein S20